MTAKLTAPTVHLNGTSGNELADGYMKAAVAIQTAIEAIYETYPNERDYYLQEPGAHARACNEAIERAKRLICVRDAMLGLYETVMEQLDKKQKQTVR